MAKQKNNIIMRSTRGMVGGQIVFKRRAGKGYVSAAPEVNENRQPTAAQKAVQDKFKASIVYAKNAIMQLAVKMAYQLKAARHQSAFNVAFLDAQNAPKIESLLTSGYTGAIGSIIIARASDDFKVSSLKISIRNSNNELIEEGPAIAEPGDLWSYTATANNLTLSGTKIKATAYDIPENEGSLEVTL